MSFIHLLFPPGEIELQDHVWHAQAPSIKKRLHEDCHLEERDLEHPSKRRYMVHPQSRSMNGCSKHIMEWRTKYLLSKLLRNNDSSINRQTSLIRGQSNVGRIFRPKYPIPLSHKQRAQTPEFTTPSVEESRSSPSTIDADENSPPSPYERFDTPSTPSSRCSDFRPEPFGRIFDSLRVTDQEREFLEEMALDNATSKADFEPKDNFRFYIDQRSRAPADGGGHISDSESAITAAPVQGGDVCQ